MSWLSEAFHGDFQPLVHGVGNITGINDIAKMQWKDIGGHNTLKDLGFLAAIAGGGLGLGALAGAGGLAAFGLGEAGAATAGAEAGAFGGLEAGSLDTLAATGGLGGEIPAAAGGVGAGSEFAGIGTAGTAEVLAGAGGDAGGALGFAGDAATAGGANPIASDFAAMGFGPSPTAGTSAASVAGPAGAGGVTDLTTVPFDASAMASGMDPAAGVAGPSMDFAPAGAGGAPVPPGSIPPAGAAPGAAPSGGGMSLSSMVSDPMGAMKGLVTEPIKNPLGLTLATAGLGYNIMQGQSQSKAVKAMEASAAQQGAIGQQLSSYLLQGKLPPGLQTALDQATASAKANAVANAAKNGQSTDPTQNTMLAQQLEAIDMQAKAQIASIGESLLQAGATESGMADKLYAELAAIDQQQTTNIGKAIANMAAALNTGKTTIQIGGTSGA